MNHTNESPVSACLKSFYGKTVDPSPLRIGSRLEKFRIEKRLGEGGFATVYAAHDLIEDRKVALKIPDLHHLSNSQSLEDMHRDVKPENFVLFEDQTLQLTDFGLARNEQRGYEVSASGTLGYMSPEQAMGQPSYRSDVFSLGLVIYRTLAGEVPEYPLTTDPSH